MVQLFVFLREFLVRVRKVFRANIEGHTNGKKVSKCNVTSTETYQGYIGYKREAFNIFTLAIFNTN